MSDLRKVGLVLAAVVGLGSSLSSALALASTVAAETDRGGEIGDGKTILYVNQLIGFELRYPAHWERFDLDDQVSFIAPDAVRASDTPETSSLVVSTQWLDQVATTDDLAKVLAETRPEVTWVATERDGLAGFMSLDGARSELQLLRTPGEVITVHAGAGSSDDAAVVEAMTSSLRLMPAGESSR